MDEANVRVLLVEDEPAYAGLIESVLRELSASRCELSIAGRLGAVQERLAERPCDVILLDLTLPDRQGLETYRDAKRMAGAVPIIVLTGSDDERLALQAMREGAQDYLVKNQVDGHVLLRVIRYAIERKRAQETLREREEFFRLISENVQDLVTVIDRDGRRLYNSPSYDAILAGPDSLSGSGPFREVHPADRDQVQAAFQETLRTGVGRRLEYRLLLNDGTVRYLESQGSVIRDAHGQPAKVLLVSRDITERKEAVGVLRQALADLKNSHEELQAAQRQLIEAEKLEAISTFAGGVAHEVKNPLQAIVLGIDYLTSHGSNRDETTAAVLEEMSSAVQRADAIIRGLVEFSAYRKHEVRDLDLSAIVDQALLAVQNELALYPVVLRRHLAEGLPPLRLDSKTIKHVFINLLTNAIQAMREGGTLTVRTSARQLAEGDPQGTGRNRVFKPGDVVVTAEIADTGPGIIESRVTGASDTELMRRSVRKGSTLGLTVVRKIIELYGGAVETVNRPEGGVNVMVSFRAHSTHPA